MEERLPRHITFGKTTAKAGERQAPNNTTKDGYDAVDSSCPVCGGQGMPQRAKLICSRCGAIIQTCCD